MYASLSMEKSESCSLFSWARKSKTRTKDIATRATLPVLWELLNLIEWLLLYRAICRTSIEGQPYPAGIGALTEIAICMTIANHTRRPKQSWEWQLDFHDIHWAADQRSWGELSSLPGCPRLIMKAYLVPTIFLFLLEIHRMKACLSFQIWTLLTRERCLLERK